VGVQELAPGTLLGHYKLIRRLGQGGMGVVYEAADQKLGRRVAVKLLIEATRNDRSALERFWREARTASSLNHPGICTIYELTEAAESPFIVMELLEGNSLEKLSRGIPMPYPRLVELGGQLVDALDAAHRKGILHRDIKPANIFLTESGQVKLLDFGLAKLEDAAKGAASDFPDHPDGLAPTAVHSLTSSGSSVGTVAYMSPEQARGEELDVRSDLFSLGVVLYEMATGQHPFAGNTTAIVFDRILNQTPIAPTILNRELPPEFENILNKTLEKDRELRCQSAAELRADLRRMQRKSGSGPVAVAPLIAFAGNVSLPVSSGDDSVGMRPASSRQAPVSEITGSNRRLLPALAILLIAGAGVAGWRLWPRPIPFASVAVNQITNVGTIDRIALSADGRFLAEVKNEAGQRTLWVRNTVTNTDTQILGPFANEYVGLTFSPDGNYLYFTRGTPENSSLHALYAMPVFGGTPRQLVTDIDSAVSFGPDGNRFVYVKWTPERKDQYSELHLADKDGGNNQILYTTPELVGAPEWSPDGSRVAWLGSVGITGKAALHLLDLSSKKMSTVPGALDISLSADSSGYTTLAWLADNRHLIAIYRKRHTDRAQIGVLAASSGEFHPITNDVNAYSQLALSGDGRTLATVLTNVDSSVAYYKADGGVPSSITPSRINPLRITPTTIAWPSDDHLLFTARGVGVGTIDSVTGNLHTFDMGGAEIGGFVAACPDSHILVTGVPPGAAESRLFRMNADGGGLTQLTTNGVARAPSCSLDSKRVYYSLRSGPQVALWSIPLDGGSPKELIQPGNFYSAAISRDGSLAATNLLQQFKMTSTVTDLNNHHTVAIVPLEQSVFINYMHFSPDSRALVYPTARDGGNTLLSQPIDGSAPRALFEPVPEVLRDFAWSPSGRELAVMRLKSSSDVVLITDQRGKE
jgi:serine/threonine protein kinase